MDLNKETLLKQFQIVKQETNTSHVMQYGELVGSFDSIAFLIYLYLLLTSPVWGRGGDASQVKLYSRLM